MKSSRRVLYILVALSLSLAALGDEMPRVAYYPDLPNFKPHWVASDAALTSEGRLDTAVFEDAAVEHLKRWLGGTERGEECLQIENKIPESPVPGKETLADQTRASDWIFFAEVTGRIPGFRSVRPGTLLRIEPTQVLKGPVDRNFPHYVFLPVGEVPLGKRRLCVEDVRFPELPELGEQVLLYLPLNAFTEGEFLFGDDGMMVTFPREQGASLPGRFRESSASLIGVSPEAFLEFTESIVSAYPSE